MVVSRSKVYTNAEIAENIINNLTVKDLQKILKDNKLPTSGKRNDLIYRAQNLKEPLIPLWPIHDETKPLSKSKYLYDPEGNSIKNTATALDFTSPKRRKQLEQLGIKPYRPLEDNAPQYIRPLDIRPVPAQKYQQITPTMFNLDDIPIKYLDSEILPEKPKGSKYKEEPTRRPEKRIRKKSKGDPADISKWPLPELRDFMRAHKIKGISKNKPEIVAIINKYIGNT
jgi:hypothetical protein